MEIGILGSGDVGRALGKGFAASGYNVKIGTRNPDKKELKEWLVEVKDNGSVGSFADTAKYGNILLLCCTGNVAEEVIELAGKENFKGKLLIDVTNPLKFAKDSPPGLFVGTTDSLGERVQRLLPDTKVVKCFNTVPNSQMFKPKYDGAEMIICGNDAEAKKQVTSILKEFGWKDSIDIGGIDGSRWMEAQVVLWLRTGMTLNTFNHIFRIMR